MKSKEVRRKQDLKRAGGVCGEGGQRNVREVLRLMFVGDIVYILLSVHAKTQTPFLLGRYLHSRQLYAVLLKYRRMSHE